MNEITITIVTPFYYPQINGVSHVVQKNVEVLLDLGYKVIVLTNKDGKAKSNEEVFNFDINGNGTIFNPIRGNKKKFIKDAIFHTKDSRLIIVHCWHIWSTNLILDNFNKFKSKIVVYSHGTSTRSRKFNLYYVLRYINYFFESYKLNKYLNLIDGLISITDKKEHFRCLDINKISNNKNNLLCNPIIERDINLQASIDASTRYEDFFKSDLKIAFCLSNYEEIKNQKYLIDLVDKHSFKLICVGSKITPYYHKLKKYIKLKNLEDKVILDYAIDDSTVEWLFENCNFFLFSSRNDFSPLVLIESSKYSLPFISFNTADTNRMGGYFCSDEKEYEFYLKKIILNENNLLEQIGKEGLLHYEKNNSLETYQSNFKKIISNILINSSK